MTELSRVWSGRVAFLRAWQAQQPTATTDATAVPSSNKEGLDALAADSPSGEPPEYSKGVLPYPGLRSFDQNESEYFFGRREHTKALLDQIEQRQVISVLGGSGSGKSSVVRAGMIPALSGSYKLPGRLGHWYIAECKPGLRPVEEVCEALWSQIGAGLILKQPKGRKALCTALDGTGDLRRIVSDAATDDDKRELRKLFLNELRPNGNLSSEGALWFASDFLEQIEQELYPFSGGAPSLMLVVDQFEELFNADVDPQQRNDFFALLKRIFDGSHNQTSPGFYVVLTMRSEQLHRCAEFAELSQIINGSMYLIDLVDEHALREAMVRPARRACESWQLPIREGPTAPFDSDVAEVLLHESAQLRESISNKADELPLLQHALKLVWQAAVGRWARSVDSVQAPAFAISRADLPSWDESTGVGFLRGCLNTAVDTAYKKAKTVYCGSNRPGRELESEADRVLRAFFIALARSDDRGNWARRLVTHHELLSVLQDRPFAGRRGARPACVDEDRLKKALDVFVREPLNNPRTMAQWAH